MMTPWLHALVLSAASTLPSPQTPVEEEGEPTEVGALAPAGAWVTHGGSPARTRASATRPLRGTPRLSWGLEAPGPIEGDPVVWGNLIAVGYRDESGRSVLLSDLRDGSEIKTLAFPDARASLGLCLWKHTLLVRASPTELRAFRVGTGGARPVWSYGGEHLGEPLLFGDEVYVLEGGSLSRLTVGSDEPVWTSQEQQHGRPSLRGEDVFVPSRVGDTFAIDRLGRASGDLRKRYTPVSAEVGLPRSKRPGTTFVSVQASGIVIYLEEPLEMANGLSSPSLFEPFDNPGPHEAFQSSWLFHGTEATEVASGFMTQALDEESRFSWLIGSGKGYIPLANVDNHADLARDGCMPARSGSGVYFAGVAADLESMGVLWRIGEGVEAMIPAREAVLVRRGERGLEAWRERDLVAGSTLAESASEEGPGDRIVDGSAVLLDGTIERGDFEFRELSTGTCLRWLRREGSSSDLRRKPQHPIEEVLLVLDGEERVVFAPRATALLRGSTRLVEEELASQFTELATDALPAKDFDLVAALVDRAREFGADDKALKRPLGSLARKRGDGAKARIEDRAAEIEARWTALEDVPPGRLLAMARALSTEEHDLRFQLLRGALGWNPNHEASIEEALALPMELRFQLLRDVLTQDPENAGIATAVRGMLPDTIDPPEPFATGEWIDYLEAVSRTSVRIVDPPEPTGDLSFGERRLGKATLHWRKDLKGFETEHLFVITPVERPGSLARCLAVGELVCATLDEIFEGQGSAVRDERFPLVVYLCESRKEYLRQAARNTGHAGLSWTAGYFDPRENVSRLFLPDGDESFEEVTSVLVHELTHQWLQNRCPLFTSQQAREKYGKPLTKGHWVVEGFASLIEEFIFDTASWTWTSDNPNSRRRDLTVAAPEGARIPWEHLFGSDHRDFARFDKKPEIRIPLRTKLGRVAPASEISLFYAQSQTACYYLFAGDDGAHRPALLEYVGAYYRGDADQLDVEECFGMTPEELGERAIRFAEASIE